MHAVIDVLPESYMTSPLTEAKLMINAMPSCRLKGVVVVFAGKQDHDGAP